MKIVQSNLHFPLIINDYAINLTKSYETVYCLKKIKGILFIKYKNRKFLKIGLVNKTYFKLCVMRNNIYTL